MQPEVVRKFLVRKKIYKNLEFILRVWTPNLPGRCMKTAPEGGGTCSAYAGGVYREPLNAIKSLLTNIFF